jgi:hypothetical protein
MFPPAKTFTLCYICDINTMNKYPGNRFLMASTLICALFLWSCISYRYIRDDESLRLQKKIQGRRTANIAGGSLLTLGSAVLAYFTGVYVGYTPGGNSLKTLRLVNTSPDTLQVNLLSDVFWKDSLYCDFRDIRIPPGEKCRLLVPSSGMYNLYFSNTVNSEEDDEMIQLSPLAGAKISLTPGMTVSEKDSTRLFAK